MFADLAELLEAERLEAERLEAERLEEERLEAERLEAERLEAERLEPERRALWELELAHGVSRSMLRRTLVDLTPQGLEWHVAPSAPTIPELGWPAWAPEEYGEDWWNEYGLTTEWVVGTKSELLYDFDPAMSSRSERRARRQQTHSKQCLAARPEPAALSAGGPSTGSHPRGFRRQKWRKVWR